MDKFKTHDSLVTNESKDRRSKNLIDTLNSEEL